MKEWIRIQGKKIEPKKLGSANTVADDSDKDDSSVQENGNEDYNFQTMKILNIKGKQQVTQKIK